MKPEYKTAIKALEYRRSAIIVNANLHDILGARTPMCINAAKENKKILAAIKLFEDSDKQMEMEI